jgi:hypothetical protein
MKSVLTINDWCFNLICTNTPNNSCLGEKDAQCTD